MNLCKCCNKEGSWIKYCSVKCACIDRNRSKTQRDIVSKSNILHNKTRLLSVRAKKIYTNGMTEVEYKLFTNQYFPKSFVSQRKAVKGAGNGYKSDFVDFKSKTIVEIDGWGHNKSKDHFRDFFHAVSGFHTLRFTNDEIREYCDDIAIYINKRIIKRELLNA